MPPSLKIPVPCSVNPPAPVIEPEYVALILLPSIVNVPAPRATLPPKRPPPDREPIDWLNPFRSKPAPAAFAMTTTEFCGRALATPP